MSYSEGLTFTDDKKARRFARMERAIRAALDHEKDAQAAAHLRTALDDIYQAEQLSYGDAITLKAHGPDHQSPCPTCQYLRQTIPASRLTPEQVAYENGELK